jgi:dTDP-4-amino-4,6-dideoxygalactose transaminase
MVTNNDEWAKELGYMRNFGHDGPEKFHGVGINGKNSEIHAAMGLCNLNLLDDILKRRKELCDYYDTKLQGVNVRRPIISPKVKYNYAYYPVIFESETALLKAVQALHNVYVYPRRYFYPSLETLNYVEYRPVPVSSEVSKCALCLPLYHTLSFEEIDMIVRALRKI